MKILLPGNLFSNSPTHLFITCGLFFLIIIGYHLMISLYTHNHRLCLKGVNSQRDNDAYVLEHPKHLNNRILATTHSIITFFCSVYLIYKYGYRLGTQNNHSEVMLICFSFSFMIYDTIYEAFNNSPAMFFHHIISLMTLGFCLFSNTCASEIFLAIIATEGSTPFLHLRYFAKEYLKSLDILVSINKDRITNQPINPNSPEYLELKNSLNFTNLIAGKIFAINFLIGRLILGPLATYLTLSSAKSPLLIKLGAFSIQLISFYWSYKLINKAIRKFKKKD